jgi:hypothetical protein
LGRDGFDERADDVQKLCQPSQKETEVVADRGEDGVDAVACATFELRSMRCLADSQVDENPPHKYLALYELETDNLDAALADLKSRVGTVDMVMT